MKRKRAFYYFANAHALDEPNDPPSKKLDRLDSKLTRSLRPFQIWKVPDPDIDSSSVLSISKTSTKKPSDGNLLRVS